MTSRAFIAGCLGTSLTPDERAFFRDARPWGFILFKRNTQDPAQVAALTAQMRDCVGWQAPIGALGKMVSGRFSLSCGVFSLDGGPSVRVALAPMPGAPRGNVMDAVHIVLEKLREGGADKIIARSQHEFSPT